MRLYVAGKALMSMRAASNLRRLNKEYFDDRCQIEIIDVFEAPQRAMVDNILVTPTLIKVAPEPVVRIIGDLSATERVLFSLGVVT